MGSTSPDQREAGLIKKGVEKLLKKLDSEINTLKALFQKSM
jgi:hypothetical protein